MQARYGKDLKNPNYLSSSSESENAAFFFLAGAAGFFLGFGASSSESEFWL